MYIDKFDKATGLLANSLAPYKFRMSYIAKPAKVVYDEDIDDFYHHYINFIQK